MYSILLILAFAMMAYGAARVVYGHLHHQPNARVHALWIPGGAFLFVIGVAIVTWL